MRADDEQIRRLAEGLLNALTTQGGVTLKAGREKVQARIEAVLRAGVSQEQDLEQEARRLLEIHMKSAPPQVDRQKLFHMIKKKLAEERGIPL